MRTVFRCNAEDGHIICNTTLCAFAGHYGFHPKACRPYRAQTKGEVERPFRYVRVSFQSRLQRSPLKYSGLPCHSPLQYWPKWDAKTYNLSKLDHSALQLGGKKCAANGRD